MHNINDLNPEPQSANGKAHTNLQKEAPLPHPPTPTQHTKRHRKHTKRVRRKIKNTKNIDKNPNKMFLTILSFSVKPVRKPRN
jgi:hypothetical protein